MKNYIILLIALITIGCSDSIPEYNVNIENTDGIFTNTNLITAEEAKHIANNAAFYFKSPRSRATTRQSDGSHIYPLIEYTARSSSDTLMYIVNYDDGNGFAIISARRIAEPVLAVIDNGSYIPDNKSDNPGFNIFMNAAKIYVKNAVPLLDRIPMPDDDDFGVLFKNKIDTLSKGYLEPKLGDLAWGQDKFYGDLCPNSIAGCSPLAISMIICYMEPRLGGYIEYTYPEATIKSENLNYKDILRHKKYVESKTANHNTKIEHICDVWYNGHEQLMRLIRQVGHIADSDYSNPSQTSTKRAKYKPTIDYFMHSDVDNLKDFDSKETIGHLDKGLLFMDAIDKYDGGGHSWVADGYNYWKIYREIYQKNKDTGLWELYKSGVESTYTTHYNLGWDGDKNGFYNDAIFTSNYNDNLQLTKPTYIAVTK